MEVGKEDEDEIKYKAQRCCDPKGEKMGQPAVLILLVTRETVFVFGCGLDSPSHAIPSVRPVFPTVADSTTSDPVLTTHGSQNVRVS